MTESETLFEIVGYERKSKTVAKKLKKMGFKVQYTKQKGELVGKSSTYMHKRSCVSIVGKKKFKNWKKKTTKLLEEIKSNLPNIKKVCKPYNAILSMVIYIEGNDCPPVYLTKRQLKLLNKINAKFDVDLYVLPEEKN